MPWLRAGSSAGPDAVVTDGWSSPPPGMLAINNSDAQGSVAAGELQPLLEHHELPAPERCHHGSGLTRRLGQATRAWSASHITIVMCFSTPIFYIGTYFIKYPIFILPMSRWHHAWVSLSLTAGFGLSKVGAYYFVGGMHPHQRLPLLLGLYSLMFVLLVGLYAWLPFWAEIAAIFLGSLPASWIFGVVFRYVEGRGHTEYVNAALACVIVFGSAAARAVGKAFLDLLPGHWMPVATAGSIFPLSILALMVMDSMPLPDRRDEKMRTARRPMSSAARKAFIRRHAALLVCIILVLACLTVLRFFRDFYAAKIYADLLDVSSVSSGTYLLADWPGGGLSIVILSLYGMFKGNRNALLAMLTVILATSLLMGIFSLLHVFGLISPLTFIISVGATLFPAYSSCGALFYDRLIAVTRDDGVNSSALIYLGDGYGYIGTGSLLLWIMFSSSDIGYVAIFKWLTLGWAVMGTLLALVAIVLVLTRIADDSHLVALAEREDNDTLKAPARPPQPADADPIAKA